MLFDQDFEVFLADTPVGVSLHKQVRYRVFCLERGFEDPHAFTNGEESDQWDTHSAHFVVRHKQTGKWVAAMRIIRPHEGALPVESIGSLLPGCTDGIAQEQIGEISRFCIARDSDFESDADWIGGVPQVAQHEITLGLFRAIKKYSNDNDMPYCYALVTDAFARLLRRIGVSLYQAGEPTEHRGTRTPYVVDFSETKATILSRFKELSEFVARDEVAYRPMSKAPAQVSARFLRQQRIAVATAHAA